VQTVLESQPDNPEALYLLARSLEKLNRPDEALAALEKAMPLFENPFPLKFESVQLLRRSNGLEAALAEIQEMVVHYPRQPELFATLSEWLQEGGKEDHAVQAARLALQYDQGQLSLEHRARLNYLIGVQMQSAGQLDQAIHHLSEAVENSPDHVEAYLALGETYQERREHKQALKTYQKAINNTDADFRPYYHAGQVLKECKDYLAAEAMLRRAAQIAPDEVSVHRLLGAVVALNLVHNRKLTPS
jgi:tetratricopeptide (TPR) repeat protein